MLRIGRAGRGVLLFPRNEGRVNRDLSALAQAAPLLFRPSIGI
ncbi:hypothetical protein DA2_2702 [Desulfovibrio sp. A2]|nr:hypothetical protein DA2_2702 [Desulfovibrio sp. A2]